MSSSRAIVLLSGGMDSALCLAMAAKNHQEIYTLFTSYGQKTYEAEKKAVKSLCQHFQVPRTNQKEVNLDFLKQLGGSSLTDQKIQVDQHQDSDQNAPTSYVPFRNSLILSMAVSWSEILKANSIYIGANELDAPGYPDCRPSYYQAFQELIHQGSNPPYPTIQTPIIHLTKEEIIQKGDDLGVPWELTWSCYQENQKPCGVCDSCYLRQKGFERLGRVDPVLLT